ncbi:MAG: leucine-rich repeat protein [Clostridiaceae bacterium]|nr:leucine-rich repeat protein [Clostridiaceae bacterium]MBW4860671.1 leucine-rich repeat protein [Clostridiaceae bacterium]
MKNKSIRKCLSFLMAFTMIFSTISFSFAEGLEADKDTVKLDKEEIELGETLTLKIHIADYKPAINSTDVHAKAFMYKNGKMVKDGRRPWQIGVVNDDINENGDGEIGISIPESYGIGEYEIEVQWMNSLTKTTKLSFTVKEVEPNIFEFNKETGTITKYTGSSKDVTIPEEIDGVKVKKIGSGVFASKELESVTILNGIEKIGERAFLGNQLKSVEIPDSVTYIDKLAFAGNELTNVKFSKILTSIGVEAFKDNKLEEVEIPNSVKNIDRSAFQNNKLTKANIPDNLEGIGYHAFANNQLEKVTIPGSLKKVDNHAFADNQIKELAIQDGVEILYWSAFANNQLTEVNIPSSVITIASGAFNNNQLTKINIPSSVETIEEEAFSNNRILQGNALIDNHEKDVDIEEGAFYNNGTDGKTEITPIFLKDQVMDGTPTIETTLKSMTTKADKITFDLWAKDHSGNKISTSNVKATNNGKPVGINWDDEEKTSYTLNLEIGTNNVEIKVNYNGKDYVENYTLIREEAEDGEVIGTFTFSMEASTVGLGYLIEPIQVNIHKGRNAAQELDEIIRTHGYKYEKTGSLESSFYLATLLDGENKIYKVKPRIPDELKRKLEENSVPYDEEDYNPEWGLGEFDFNFMSGWMYAVNNVFPNVGFADKYLQDGDVMRVQFTLAYGNDIGGADAMGGGYENNMFPKVNKDELTKKVAEINSNSRKEEYLKVKRVKDAYDESIRVLQAFGVSQEEIDKTLENLETAINNVSQVVSVKEIEEIEVDYGTSKEEVIEKLPTKITLNLSNGTKEEVDVTWTSEEYAENKAGDYTFAGSYELPEGVIGKKPEVNVKVTVKEEVITIKEISQIEEIEVNYGTSKEEVIEKLPIKITLNLSNGTKEEVDITWTSEEYAENKAGDYTFVGSYELPEGVTGKKPEVNVKVTVKEEPVPEVDKSKLEEILKSVEGLETEGKTEESVKALEEAISLGKEILVKEEVTQEEVTQEEVDNAVKAIKTAISNLEDKEEPVKPTEPNDKDSEKPIKPTKPNKPNKPGTIDKVDNKPTKPKVEDKPAKTSLPKTGQSSMLWLSILGMILLAVGANLWINKRKEKEA